MDKNKNKLVWAEPHSRFPLSFPLISPEVNVPQSSYFEKLYSGSRIPGFQFLAHLPGGALKVSVGWVGGGVGWWGLLNYVVTPTSPWVDCPGLRNFWFLLWEILWHSKIILYSTNNNIKICYRSCSNLGWYEVTLVQMLVWFQPYWIGN
jgi:hypothetical protein